MLLVHKIICNKQSHNFYLKRKTNVREYTVTSQKLIISGLFPIPFTTY